MIEKPSLRGGFCLCTRYLYTDQSVKVFTPPTGYNHVPTQDSQNTRLGNAGK